MSEDAQTGAPAPAPDGSWRETSVLVTGATGFIGQRLCARLGELGADVRGVSRSPAPPHHTAAHHVADLSSRQAVISLLEDVRPGYVVHLAGLVKGSRDRSLVVPALEANLMSTVYLLDAAQRVGCRRFVQAGSLEEPPLDEPVAVPSSPYAASKAAATAYCRMWAELYGLPVTLARIFMVYGPGHQDEKKLVPYVVREQLEGRRPEISSGTREVDWIFVDDLVEGLVRLLRADLEPGTQVDLGSGELHTVREVAETICRLGGGGVSPRVGARADRQQEQVRRARVDETRRLLGWAPSTSLEEGLRRTIDWFASTAAESSA